MRRDQLVLFPDVDFREEDRLYIIGNGFDIHHCINSRYSDFRSWLQNENPSFVGMMDIFFSNDCEFWADIEKALGEYREGEITNYCEPIISEDYKYEHPWVWQAGLEDNISSIFGEAMKDFREAFEKWVRSIDISGIEADMVIPIESKYLTFNYTETLESYYHVPTNNVLHIHGNRLKKGDKLVIGHSNYRDSNVPYEDESLLFPYQKSNSEVIEIMNEWTKNPHNLIDVNKFFFQSLEDCKAVCVIGLSYNDIDMPYLEEVASFVDGDSKWWLYYYTETDYNKAKDAAQALRLKNYCLKQFE